MAESGTATTKHPPAAAAGGMKARPATAGWGLPYPVPADEVRSATMSAIRRADTKPERLIRSGLHRRGYRFRKDYKLSAPRRAVRADIAFPREGLAVFIDGCYWHQCPEHGTVPKTNRDYWVPKLRRNVQRDALVTESLQRRGWSVLRVWEHVAPAEAVELIAAAVDSLRARGDLRTDELSAATAVDLFAGAGGSTEGLKRSGYRVLGAVEYDGVCSETYRANHPGVTLFEQDISGLSPKRFRETLGLKRGEVDLLNACPPCQGFSTLGSSDADDGRNDLVSTVLTFVEELMPRAFLVENVPGLARDRRMKALLAKTRGLGYSVKTYLVNATEFGVSQNRRRLIAIGVVGIGEDALPDHPVERAPRSFEREPEPITEVLARAGPLEGTRDPVHRARSSTPTVAERIKQIPINGSRFDLPESHQLDCHKSVRRSAAASPYGRIRTDEPAPTLTTRCTTPACGRFVHPTENRGISLREAALIQTFPRGYRFEGTYQSIEAQIGNAVPVRMAQGLGLAVRELLLEDLSG